MHRPYSIPYMKAWCWPTRSNSKNETNLKSKKSLINSDKEMEINFVFHESGWVHYILLIILIQMPARHDFNYLYVIMKTRFLKLGHRIH